MWDKLKVRFADTLVEHLAEEGSFEVPYIGELTYDSETKYVEIYPSKDFLYRLDQQVKKEHKKNG